MSVTKNKSKFPARVVAMIKTAHSKGWNGDKTATYINGSKLATKLGLRYTSRSIAAKLASITLANSTI